jgi:hypothetical protein
METRGLMPMPIKLNVVTQHLLGRELLNILEQWRTWAAHHGELPAYDGVNAALR